MDSMLSPADLAQRGEDRIDHAGAKTHSRARRWGRNIAVGLLAAYVVVALLVAWARWGQFNPNVSSQGREIAHIQLSPAEHPWCYPMLLLHVTASSVALAACVFQIWPWLRRRHPRVHRNVGRIYVFAGVYPAVFFALVVQAFWPFSVPTAISQVVPLTLWAAFTTCGFVARRRGRMVEHRRWMLRSFGLTCLVLMELTIDPIVVALVRTEQWWLARHPLPSPQEPLPRPTGADREERATTAGVA